MSTARHRVWTPYFLTEKGTRTYLQTLYTSIVGSNQNAQSLLSDDIQNIAVASQDGNALVKRCFAHTGRWLRMARGFCKSEETFRNQILEPSRIPARYLLRIREGTDHSTKLEGFVFARTSEFYNNNFGSNMRILSVIVPQLGSALSLRCRSTVADSILGETVEIEGVQPVPFVNRIHTTARLSIRRSNRAIELQKLHFIRVSIHDLPRLSQSLAFENLCEVHSVQADNRRLGLPCVITGRVLSIDSPYIWIEDETNESFTRLLITQFLVQQIGGDVARLSLYKSKPVRFLAVVWYSLGAREQPVTEVFRVEPMDDSNLNFEDAIGYVRLRGEITRAALSKRYPSLDIDSLLRILSQDNNRVIWAGLTNPLDAISQDFVHHTARLLGFRSAQGSAWIWAARPSDVFDRTRLVIGYIAKKISRDDRLWSCILEVLRILDYLGSLPPSISELKRTLSAVGIQSIDDAVSWLTGLSILVREKNEIALTKRGIEATYLSCKATISDIIRIALGTEDHLDLLDLEQQSQFPPTLLLRGLQELERQGLVSRLAFSEHHSTLIWVPKFPIEDEQARLKDARKWLDTVIQQVLLTLGKVPHSLGTLKLAEGLSGRTSASFLSTNALLLDMEALGLIEKTGENSWVYPWKQRIIDYLRTQGQGMFSEDDITAKTNLPLVERTKVKALLEELRKDQKVIQILPGQWAILLADPVAQKVRMQSILSSYCMRFLKQRLTGIGGFERRTLADAKDYLSSEFGDSATSSIDLRRICEDTVSIMLRTGDLERVGILLRLKTQSS